jgi:hypothetical protein
LPDLPPLLLEPARVMTDPQASPSTLTRAADTRQWLPRLYRSRVASVPTVADLAGLREVGDRGDVEIRKRWLTDTRPRYRRAHLSAPARLSWPPSLRRASLAAAGSAPDELLCVPERSPFRVALAHTRGSRLW